MNAREYVMQGPTVLDELYHENSKHSVTRMSFANGVQMAERDRALHAMYKESKGRHKTYTSFGVVSLSKELLALSSTLDQAIATRGSQRSFHQDPLTFAELSTLLARGYGICGERHGMVARTVPSGGGLYPLDLYVLQFAGGAIDEGVYHYHVGAHALQRIAPQCDRADVAGASIYPDVIGNAAIVIAIVADMNRVRVKYGDRAYRLALLEAGHVGQNLYLIASALRLGIVALDGFYDDKLHAILDVDGLCEIGLIVFAIGRLP